MVSPNTGSTPLPGMAGGQLERSKRGHVQPEEPEKVLLVCHELEVWEDECISPASAGMNQKWNRQSGYLQSEAAKSIRLTLFRRTSELERA